MATSEPVETLLPVMPHGWEQTRDGSGLVFDSPDVDVERNYRVRWWGAHHDGLYVEGYDYAVVVPRAVVFALLASQGWRVQSGRAAALGPSCSEPEDVEVDFSGCPAVGVGGMHSESYGQDGEHRCDGCGARPVLPVRRAGKQVSGRTCDRPCAEPS